MRDPLLIAVDTNPLIDFALQDEDVWDCLSTIRLKRPRAKFLVPPTVLQELAFGSLNFPSEIRQACTNALTHLLQWKMKPVNLIPAGHGIVEVVAQRIRDKGLIPQEEKNDSLILAESGLLQCKILLTSDTHLRAVEYEKLAWEMSAYDLHAPIISTPREIVKKFWPK